MKFRLLNEKDLLLRVKWMNDVRIYSTMHFKPPILMEDTIQWFNINKDNSQREDFVFETLDGEVLSMSGLTGLDTDILKMESYIFVNPSIKTKGLGKKTLFLQCIYAFEILRINKIYAYIDSDNVASQRLYTKIGFKKEGILRNETRRENGFIDRYYYGCFIGDLDKSLFQYQVNYDYKEIILL